jgi:hypothetical protein
MCIVEKYGGAVKLRERQKADSSLGKKRALDFDSKSVPKDKPWP